MEVVNGGIRRWYRISHAYVLYAMGAITSLFRVLFKGVFDPIIRVLFNPFKGVYNMLSYDGDLAREKCA